jgi:hypothetical protein
VSAILTAVLLEHERPFWMPLIVALDTPDSSTSLSCVMFRRAISVTSLILSILNILTSQFIADTFVSI